MIISFKRVSDLGILLQHRLLLSDDLSVIFTESFSHLPALYQLPLSAGLGFKKQTEHIDR